VDADLCQHDLPNCVKRSSPPGSAPAVFGAVATHAGNSPFRGRNFAAYLLHDAAYFATDHATMQAGEAKQSYYQKHWRQGGQIRRGGDHLSSHPPPA